MVECVAERSCSPPRAPWPCPCRARAHGLVLARRAQRRVDAAGRLGVIDSDQSSARSEQRLERRGRRPGRRRRRLGKEGLPGRHGRDPAPANGQPFCIDRTEVTNSAYAKFLVMGWPTGIPPGVCGWNTKCTMSSRPTRHRRTSVVGVDRCDISVLPRRRKRLCGSTKGGAVDPSLNSSVGDSFAACTTTASRASLRRQDRRPQQMQRLLTCRRLTPRSGPRGPRQNVGSRSQCEGGYKGIFDMSGRSGRTLLTAASARRTRRTRATTAGGARRLRRPQPEPEVDCLMCESCGAGRPA